MSKHDFLSDEWIEAAQALSAEYEGTITNPPPPMKMNIVVKEVPFGEGSLDAHLDTSAGETVLNLGHLDTPDLTVTVPYAVAKALFVDNDPQAGMQAFMQGKIQVQGDMTKMMAMQTVQPDPKQIEMTQKLSEMTA